MMPMTTAHKLQYVDLEADNPVLPSSDDDDPELIVLHENMNPMAVLTDSNDSDYRIKSWWEQIPKTFVLLIVFCFGFALCSLIGIVLFATSSSSPFNAKGGNFLLCIGIMSSMVGSLQTASGYCAQRLGHQIDIADSSISKNDEEQGTENAKKHRNHPLVFVGVLLLVCGTIAAITNLGLLGQSVTAPFAAMTLIFNGILACTVLREPITRYDIVATILVLIGVCIAVIGVASADDMKSRPFALADMERVLFQTRFPPIYSVSMLLGLFICYWYVTRENLQRSSMGLCVFAIGAGVLSGFSSLCVKCTVELATQAIQHDASDLRNPFAYVFILGIPLCVISQLKLMTTGLRYFGTLKFVPPYQACIILSNLVNGMVYFEEAAYYNWNAAVLFAMGCGLTISGVLLLLAKVSLEERSLTSTTGATDERNNPTLSHSKKVKSKRWLKNDQVSPEVPNESINVKTMDLHIQIEMPVRTSTIAIVC